VAHLAAIEQARLAGEQRRAGAGDRAPAVLGEVDQEVAVLHDGVIDRRMVDVERRLREVDGPVRQFRAGALEAVDVLRRADVEPAERLLDPIRGFVGAGDRDRLPDAKLSGLMRRDG
jgi:hypothetical protein